MNNILKSKYGKIIAASATAVVVCAMIIAVCLAMPKSEDKKSDDTTEVLLETTTAESTEKEVADVEEVSHEVVMKPQETTTEKETEPVYDGPFAGKFVVNISSDYLNVRANNSTDAEVVGKLYVGAGGKVLKKGKNWTKIKSGSVTGWVSTEYLVFDEEAEKKANEVGTLNVTITADTLRVREEAGTDSSVEGVVGKGETFVGQFVNDEWIAITFEGETGYISAEFATTELTIGKAISIEEEMEAIRLEQERIAAEKAEAERLEQERQKAMEQAVANSSIVETVQGAKYNITEEEAYMIACVITAEAGYECYEGQLAVANIILNRYASGRYASIKDVLYAPGQFTVVNTNRYANAVANGPFESSIKATQEAIAGKNNVPGFTSFAALWGANYSLYTEYTIIGNQVYYR